MPSKKKNPNIPCRIKIKSIHSIMKVNVQYMYNFDALELKPVHMQICV